MLPVKKKQTIYPADISKLIESHCANLMQSFYELQSSFLSGAYKKYKNLETANIIMCFSRNVHLEIIRQRERDLNYNVSLKNFYKNFNTINKPLEKISSIVKITGIPKETVRRKVKILIDLDCLSYDKKNKGYFWSLSQKDMDPFLKIMNEEAINLTTFISKIVKDLGLSLDNEGRWRLVNEEIHSQFSFYWYHYLSCQLKWLKWWQVNLKDNDLLLISLQTTIPTLKFIDKNLQSTTSKDVFKIIGKIDKNSCNKCSVSATSVSDVTGIPRATAMRKLDKLVQLGFLVREKENKRYSINQSTDLRTKNIMSRENVDFTIETFSEYISIILNSLIQNKL